MQASTAEATKQAYLADWARFETWCAADGAVTVPADPATVASYLADAAAATKPSGAWLFAPSTLTRWSASINAVHTAAGLTAPGRSDLVRRTLAGIRKTRATPPSRVPPLREPHLRAMVACLRADRASAPLQALVAERRNTALLLVGYTAALRASELVAIQRRDVTVAADGYVLLIRQSKTDQGAAGQVKALPRRQDPALCAPCAVRRLLELIDRLDTEGEVAALRHLRDHRGQSLDRHQCADAEKDAGSTELSQSKRLLFRPLGSTTAFLARPLHRESVRSILRSTARQAGLPDPVLTALGGHSLRSGFVTDAFAAGARPDEIARQTGHRSVRTLEVYRRDNPFVGNAATRLDSPRD